MIILPEIPFEHGVGVAHELLERVRGIYTIENVENHITLSIGIDTLRHDIDFENAYYWANMALLEAKKAGKNRVVVANRKAELDPELQNGTIDLR